MNLRLLMLGVVLGIILFIRVSLFYHSTSQYINLHQVGIVTTLLGEPAILGKTQHIIASDKDHNRIRVIAPMFPRFHYGDTLHISGIIQVKDKVKVSNTIAQVLGFEQPSLTIFFPKIEAAKNKVNFALSLTSFVRQRTTALFEAVLPPQSASLMLGIVFGIKQGISQDFFRLLQNAGVLHIIAASGMNVSMVGELLVSLFAVFFRRQYALAIAIVGICFYALIAGLEPSIVRAAIMGVMAFGAQILGRQYMAGYGLFIAGYGMVFFDPTLVFDIGFQLSFVATMGLIYLRPLFGKTKFVLSDDIATTIAAQLATLPILLANFGSYSVISILVNALVLWTVPILTVLGSIAASVGLLWDIPAKLFLYLSMPLLWYFEFVVTFFGNLVGNITVSALPWQFSVAYYLFLISYVSWHVRLRKPQ